MAQYPKKKKSGGGKRLVFHEEEIDGRKEHVLTDGNRTTRVYRWKNGEYRWEVYDTTTGNRMSSGTAASLKIAKKVGKDHLHTPQHRRGQ